MSKSSTPPLDNSHFPITIKPGERFSWWSDPKYRRYGSKSDGPKLRTSSKTLLDPLTSDGHIPTLTVTGTVDAWGNIEFEMKCSCGYILETQRRGYRRRLGVTGRFSTSFFPEWNGHKDKLAAPLLVWEGKAVRAKYTCHVATYDQLSSLGASMPTSTWYADHFFVVKTSSIGNKAKVVGYNASLAKATMDAKNLGIKHEEKGHDVTWHEDAPADRPSGAASVLIGVMDQAKDPGTILNAIRLADEYINYAGVIESKKQELSRRLHTLTSLEEE